MKDEGGQSLLLSHFSPKSVGETLVKKCSAQDYLQNGLLVLWLFCYDDSLFDSLRISGDLKVILCENINYFSILCQMIRSQ